MSESGFTGFSGLSEMSESGFTGFSGLSGFYENI
jgi:hypothetical protein